MVLTISYLLFANKNTISNYVSIVVLLLLTRIVDTHIIRVNVYSNILVRDCHIIYNNLGFPESHIGIIYLWLLCLYDPADKRLDVIRPNTDLFLLRHVGQIEWLFLP